MEKKYQEECFGYYMQSAIATAPLSKSAGEVMRSLFDQARKQTFIDVIFVVNEKEEYIGALTLRDLIAAERDRVMEELVDMEYPFVFAHHPKDENVDSLRESTYGALPVLDEMLHPVGVIDVAGILTMLEEEFAEDYARLGGLLQEEKPNASLWQSVVQRLPWLALLLGLGLIVSSVIGFFENVIKGLTLIVCFQSLILGMAGNGGTQSLAVTVRMISDEDLTISKRLRLLGKETLIGVCNGLILGALSVATVGIYLFIGGTAGATAFAVSGCIGFSLCIAMTFSAAAGTAIPLLFQQCGVDPAVASGPLITTLNDLSAVVIYYGLAWIFLL